MIFMKDKTKINRFMKKYICKNMEDFLNKTLKSHTYGKNRLY